MNNKLGQIGKFCIDANFYLSVLILLYGCFTAISENHSVFEFNEELYGSLHGNLRMTLIYLAVTEIAVVLFSFFLRRPKFIFFAGGYLITMLVALPLYGMFNSVPVDNNLMLFFLYTGISHSLFGLLSGWDAPSRNS